MVTVYQEAKRTVCTNNDDWCLDRHWGNDPTVVDYSIHWSIFWLVGVVRLDSTTKMNDLTGLTPCHIKPPIWDHSGPINAMPQRDLLALQGYFEHRDMAAIAADMEAALAHLWPTPVWDDDIWAAPAADTDTIATQPIPAQRASRRFDIYL